jgi:hypothetical protein
MQPPKFSDDFRRQFRELLAWHRDVRRFRRQPIDPVIFGELLGLACLAPSVGNSQPWRFGRQRTTNGDAFAASFGSNVFTVGLPYRGDQHDCRLVKHFKPKASALRVPTDVGVDLQQALHRDHDDEDNRDLDDVLVRRSPSACASWRSARLPASHPHRGAHCGGSGSG